MKYLKSKALSEESKLILSSILAQNTNIEKLVNSRFGPFYVKELFFYAKNYLAPEANEENKHFNKAINALSFVDNNVSDSLFILAEIGAKNPYLSKNVFGILKDNIKSIKNLEILKPLSEAREKKHISENDFLGLSSKIIKGNLNNDKLYDMIEGQIRVNQDKTFLSILASFPEANQERLIDLHALPKNKETDPLIENLEAIQKTSKFDEVFNREEGLNTAYYLIDLYKEKPYFEDKIIESLSYINEHNALQPFTQDIVEYSGYKPQIANIFMQQNCEDKEFMAFNAHLFMKIGSQDPLYTDEYVSYVAAAIRESEADDSLDEIFYGYYDHTHPEDILPQGLFDEKYQYLIKTFLDKDNIEGYSLAVSSENITDRLLSGIYKIYDDEGGSDDSDNGDENNKYGNSDDNDSDNNENDDQEGESAGIPEFDETKTKIFNKSLEMIVNNPNLQKDKKFFSRYMGHLYILSRAIELPQTTVKKIENLIHKNVEKIKPVEYIQSIMAKAIKNEKEFNLYSENSEGINPYTVYEKVFNLTKNVIEKENLTKKDKDKIVFSLKKLDHKKNAFNSEKYDGLLSMLETKKDVSPKIIKTKNKSR